MEKFKDVNDILDFAMEREQEAVDFYSNLAQKARSEEMKAVFTEFAEEEIRHKIKIQKVKEEGIMTLSSEKVMDLQISDYTVHKAPTPDMTYEEALVLAMNKEKAAFKLYTNLASKTDNAEIKELFLSLAAEESKHKLRFEIEYDEYVLKNN